MKKALIVTASMLFTTLSAQTISSNFNTNDDGWQARDFPLGGTNAVAYRTTGGNPTGHISFKDRNILPATTIYFVAPQKFLGNKSWAYNNTLTFDLKIETGTFFYEDDVILEGSGITLALDLPNPTTFWSSFTCTLNELSGWKVGTRNGAVATQAQMQAVLCNLTKIWIRAEFYTNFLQFDEGFLDNVALNLTPCTPNVLSQTRTICTGQNVVLNGKTYNQTGVYTDTIKRCYPQCDSIINLNLTVVDAFRTTLNPTICAGNSFLVNNKTYSQTGIYRDTLKSITNCDSIVTTNLTVLAPLSKMQEIRLCEGDFIRIGNKTYNQTGVYKDTLKTITNCDSILTTNLIVNKRFNNTQNVAICPNGSYSINNKTYNIAGIYKDTFKTINNCDSIITTNLTIQNAFTRTQNINLCSGNVYRIGVKTYSLSGIYRDSFKTIQGCDSIVITDLKINSVYSKNQTITICAGNAYLINNKNYTQTGVYKDTLKTINNCDSILMTNLIVSPPLSKMQEISICEGDFIRINNKTYNQTGVYKDTLKTLNNCDSILTTNLIVNKRFNRTQDVAICPNSVYLINNKRYTIAGVYKDTLKTMANCDSIITTNLSLFPVYSNAKTITLCAGEVYRVGVKTYSQSGVYRDTFLTINGCDSILITNLTVNPVYSKNQTITICAGNAYLINNKNYTQTGVYKDTLKTINNCDSILITNLIVAPPLSKMQDISLCEGDFIRIGNKTYNQTGIYKDTLKTLTHCDSILTTNLIVNKRFNRTQDVAICPNSVYLINNKRYTIAGIYKDTLKTITNCDSIITTNLSFIPPLSISTDFSVCKGDFIKIGNKIYNQTGIYRDTFKTVKGCDSIFITNLIIKPERKKTIDTTVCEGKQLVINGKQYLKSGIYNDTILTNAQCDSILSITIKITPYPIVKKTVILCANDSTVVDGRLFNKVGVFKDTVLSKIACSEVIEWTVQKSNLQLYMGENTTIELGDSLQLTPSVFGAPNVLWTWQSNKALSCTNCSNPFVKPLQTTTFTLTIKDTLSGCTIKNALKITVKPCESIFMPTAFSPNNDGANDYFTVFAAGCVRRVNKMQLFNRWGVLVFSKNNFFPNNEKSGWDGMMNNTQLPPDVYIYVIELELGDGKIKVFSGDVTLIR